jgi:hypothetical protein
MLSWDGSYLGEYPASAIVQKWYMGGVLYYGIVLRDEFIYVTIHRVKDLFPLIVNDLKEVFNLPRRPLHHIKFSGNMYILYPVPITSEGNLIWELPLNQLPHNHSLRSDPQFQKIVRKLFIFCDILSLPDTNETNIIIQRNQIPINNNETRSTIMKETIRDFHILPASVINRWFDEDIFMEDILCEMLHYQKNSEEYKNIRSLKSGTQRNIQSLNYESFLFDLRSRIESIIRKYDSNYIWYINFIIERICRYI